MKNIILCTLLIINNYISIANLQGVDLSSTNSELPECNIQKNNKGYYKMLFKTKETLKLGDSITISGICFNRIDIKLYEKDFKFVLEINPYGKRKFNCVETIIAFNYLFFEFKTTIFNSITFDINKDNERIVKYMHIHGISVMFACDSISKFIPNFLRTAISFMGGLGTNPNIPIFGSKIPGYQLNNNIKVIEETTGYKWEKIDKLDTFDFTSVRPGDLLFVTRFDGIDQMIQMGTGSRIGHTTIILRGENEQLYVYESQEARYWPKKNIQKNDLFTWIKWAKNADYNVIVLKLSDEKSKLFNNEKAVKFAESLLGLRYGYRTFLYSWIDTKDKNYPSTVDIDYIFILFTLIEKLDRSISDMLFTEGLNKRLGVERKSLQEIAVIMAEKNLNLAELLTIPEIEGWEYSNGKNYISTAFVSAVLRESGVLGDVKFNATELTPRDIYSLKIFNDKNIKGCNNKPYCQILGNMKIELNYYNEKEPYDNMYERCETIAPDFAYNGKC